MQTNPLLSYGDTPKQNYFNCFYLFSSFTLNKSLSCSFCLSNDVYSLSGSPVVSVSNTNIFTYEIPKYVSTFGIPYNLRNSLDFRAYKTNTAISSVNITSATINPETSITFNVDSNGLRMVAPDSDISLDYSFYLKF